MLRQNLVAPDDDSNRWLAGAGMRGRPRAAGHTRLAAFLGVLLLAGCGGTPQPEPPARPPFPELGDFPARPQPEGTLALRRDLGNELLTTRAQQQQAARELDFRVGRTAVPPGEVGPAPVMPPIPPALPPLVRAASVDVDATFLRQQIYSELTTDSLNFYMDLVARAPVDIDPLSARLSLERQEAALRGSQFFGSSPGVMGTPVLPDWGSYEPILDGWLRRVGLMAER